MAASIIFILAIFTANIFSNHVLAQNATASLDASPSTVQTTTTVAATTTIKPTAPMKTVSASASVSLNFDTSFMASARYTGVCMKNKTNQIEDGLKTLYSGYGIKTVDIKTSPDGTNCTANITIMFGSGLTKTDVIMKFENASKAGINGIKLEVIMTEIHVEGVTLGKYAPTNEDCKAKCCNGAGGEIALKRTCTPEIKCKNYRLMKMAKDCLKECNTNELCNAGITVQVSSVILVLSGIIIGLMQ